MEEEQPIKPANILNIVATNQGKRPVTKGRPKAKALSPADVEAMMGDHYIIDARSSANYGGGHIEGSINVQSSSKEFEQRVASGLRHRRTRGKTARETGPMRVDRNRRHARNRSVRGDVQQPGGSRRCLPSEVG